MSSYRTYGCVVCGELKRLETPEELVHVHQRPGGNEVLIMPAPYGHWRSLRARFGFVLPKQFYHCSRPMFILGRRAEQAATQITPEERVIWFKLGARVSEHAGKKRWRPILSERKMRDAYPLI